MPTYQYNALDSQGKTVQGVLESDHERHARDELRAQGLVPTEINAVSAKTDNESQQSKRSSKLKLRITDLTIFTRQLATLIGSGMTIEESLRAVVKQSRSIKMKSLVSELRSLVNEGFSLSDAIKKFPKSFPQIYHASVFAGEQSGNLPLVMDRLADYLENRHSVQQKISVALVYPVFLLFVSFTIVALLVTYIVPKVVSVFDNIDVELPWLTRALISTSDFMQSYGVYILALLIALGLIVKYLMQHERPRMIIHHWLLNTPMIGTFIRSIDGSRMARTLSILVGSGVPLLTSMRSCLGVVQNEVLKRDLTAATDEVAQGISVSRALDRGGNFSPLMIQMVAAGENNGQLDSMLEKAASAGESETQSRIAIFVGLFEPIMILVMGFIVLTIVLAILYPILSINQSLGS